jgi:hypothetical protein
MVGSVLLNRVQKVFFAHLARRQKTLKPLQACSPRPFYISIQEVQKSLLSLLLAIVIN